MNQDDLLFVTRVLVEQFPKWAADASEESLSLWRDNLAVFSREIAVGAIREHRIKSRITYPILEDVLRAADAKSRANVAISTKHDAADLCRRVREDEEAERRLIDSLPEARLSAAVDLVRRATDGVEGVASFVKEMDLPSSAWARPLRVLVGFAATGASGDAGAFWREIRLAGGGAP